MSDSECGNDGCQVGRNDRLEKQTVLGTVIVPGLAEFEQWLIDQKAEADSWFVKLHKEGTFEWLAFRIEEAFDSAIDELSSETDAKDETR